MDGRALLRALLLLTLVALIAAAPVLADEPALTEQAVVGLGFTYQGQLTDGGAPANGAYDFQFRVFTAEGAAGMLRGVVSTIEDIAVDDGRFTTLVTVGDVFHGEELWLEVSVRPGSSSGPFQALSPRTRLAAAPYASALRWGASMIGSGTGLSVSNRGSMGSPAIIAHSEYTALQGMAVPNGTGVYGGTAAGVGVSGEASTGPAGPGTGIGVLGTSQSGTGVRAWSGTGTALNAGGTGIIQSSATSYVFAPAALAQLHGATTGATLKYWGQGNATIQASVEGQKQLVLPISLPGVLYGQPVTVGGYASGYSCTGAASIAKVEFYITKLDGSYTYSIYTGPWTTPESEWGLISASISRHLAADEGQFALRIYCDMPAGSTIQVTGARLALTHQ
ncbi:MAG: hypothetical protein GXX94_01315 [Chloroflexi bacterium]|nr:hypothetical protein [Chloroflexota bacterium]